jgi:hypothetical protein
MDRPSDKRIIKNTRKDGLIQVGITEKNERDSDKMTHCGKNKKGW